MVTNQIIRFIFLLGLGTVACSPASVSQDQSTTEQEKSSLPASSPVATEDSNNAPKNSGKTDISAESTVESKPVLSKDGTLACSIANWRLEEDKDTVDGEEKITSSSAFYTPKFENRGQESGKEWVLIEFLATTKEGNPIPLEGGLENPTIARKFKLNAPLESGAKQLFEDEIIKFQSGWHNLEVKKCDWLTTEAEFLERYPYFKTYDGP